MTFKNSRAFWILIVSSGLTSVLNWLFTLQFEWMELIAVVYIKNCLSFVIFFFELPPVCSLCKRKYYKLRSTSTYTQRHRTITTNSFTSATEPTVEKRKKVIRNIFICIGNKYLWLALKENCATITITPTNIYPSLIFYKCRKMFKVQSAIHI